MSEYTAAYILITDYNLKAFRKNLAAVDHNRVFINDFDTFSLYNPLSVRKQVDLFEINRSIESTHEVVSAFSFSRPAA
ncbi:hypothetical protein C3438_08770 [Bacillus velezensis]|nr:MULTISPECIES: hypothetical protein [Bacillus amyloliquefaciens group]AVB09626.1 hypothetical protein C3438_08770 [Bacillus velezensis]MDU0812485.1 hypothetical protein [Bacillus siamensis]